MKKPFFVFLVLMLVLCGCAPQSPIAMSGDESLNDEPVTVRYPGGDWGYPSPFGFYMRGPGYTHMSLLFDTLVWADENGIIGLIAESWSSNADASEWTFVVRDGVVFHDGEALSVEDVVFSYEYILQHAVEFGWRCELDVVAKIEAVDERTVHFMLEKPFPDFDVVTAAAVPIIPEHIWGDVDEPELYREADALVGTGPFRLQSYSAEEGSYAYEGNSSYFAGETLVDRLVFAPVQDEALALGAGAVDSATFSGKQVSAVDALLADGSFTSIEGPAYWVLQLVFNTRSGVMSDIRVRQAVAASVDRQTLVNQVTQNGAMVANTGIISPYSSWHVDSERVPVFDVAAGAQAFEELGLVGQEISLITTSKFAREAEMIKADLEAAGLVVRIDSGDSATVDSLLREGTFDLAVNGHGAIASPTTLSTPDWPAGLWQNDEYDDLYASQASEANVETRVALVGALQQMVTDELPVLTLYHPRMWCVYDASVFEQWFFTPQGYSTGIPLPLNKLVFVERS